jgi:hypothetical protein
MSNEERKIELNVRALNDCDNVCEDLKYKEKNTNEQKLFNKCGCRDNNKEQKQ